MGNVISAVTDNWAAIAAVAALGLGIWHLVVKMTPSQVDDQIEAKVEAVAAKFGITPKT